MTEKSLGQILYEAIIEERAITPPLWCSFERSDRQCQERFERIALVVASEVRRRSTPPPMSYLEIRRCLLQKIRSEADLSTQILSCLGALQDLVEKEEKGALLPREDAGA
jgi:hypothetical protein